MAEVDMATWCLATALVHEVPSSSLALTFHDGRRAQVSHEVAFAPLLSPCLLRRAVLEHRADPTGPARWIGQVGAIELTSPFVEDRGDGVVRHHPGGHAHHTFVSPLPGEVVLEELHRCPLPDVDVTEGHVHVRLDEELGVAAVHLRGFEPDVGDLAARWLSRRLRSRQPAHR